MEHGLTAEQIAEVKAIVLGHTLSEGCDYKDAAVEVCDAIVDHFDAFPGNMPDASVSPRRFLDWKSAVTAA